MSFNEYIEKSEKPFIWIKIPNNPPSRKHIDVDKEGHHKFNSLRLSGKIHIKLTVVSQYLFVGSGSFEYNHKRDRNAPDIWHTFARRTGRLCIPGTSVKGAIRSIFETISNSCVSQVQRGREQIDEKYITCGKSKKERHKNELEKEFCPACRLFGTTGYRGRISFSDFEFISGRKEIVKIGELWQPRIKYTKRKFYWIAKFAPLSNSSPEKNHRFVEAVKRSGTFGGWIYFDNVSTEELGLLLHSMGWTLLDNGKAEIVFTPKLGGAKPRCFGSVRFEIVKMKLWSGLEGNLFSPIELENEPLNEFIVKTLKSAEESDLFNEEIWNEVMREFKFRDKVCPKGVY